LKEARQIRKKMIEESNATKFVCSQESDGKSSSLEIEESDIEPKKAVDSEYVLGNRFKHIYKSHLKTLK
jgi:hypothetical protein